MDAVTFVGCSEVVTCVSCCEREHIMDTLSVSIETKSDGALKFSLCMICVTKKLSQLLKNLPPEDAIEFLKGE